MNSDLPIPVRERPSLWGRLRGSCAVEARAWGGWRGLLCLTASGTRIALGSGAMFMMTALKIDTLYVAIMAGCTLISVIDFGTRCGERCAYLQQRVNHRELPQENSFDGCCGCQIFLSIVMGTFFSVACYLYNSQTHPSAK